MGKTLQQIKDQVASECGWDSWASLYADGKVTNGMIAQVAVRYASEQNKELQEWKESASKILNNIDLQKLGKLLEMQYGTAIDEQLLPSVIRLVEQNKEMLEMLESCLSFIEQLNGHGITNWSDEVKLRDLITKHKQQ